MSISMYESIVCQTVIQGDTKKRELLNYHCFCKTFLWRKHAVDHSTDPWLLNGEVVCSSRSLFRSAANCTWLPLRISKVPVFLCHPVFIIYYSSDSPSSLISESVCLLGKERLKERCGLESRTNFFRLRNRQKLVRIRFENMRYLTFQLRKGPSGMCCGHSTKFFLRCVIPVVLFQ